MVAGLGNNSAKPVSAVHDCVSGLTYSSIRYIQVHLRRTQDNFQETLRRLWPCFWHPKLVFYDKTSTRLCREFSSVRQTSILNCAHNDCITAEEKTDFKL